MFVCVYACAMLGIKCEWVCMQVCTGGCLNQAYFVYDQSPVEY